MATTRRPADVSLATLERLAAKLEIAPVDSAPLGAFLTDPIAFVRTSEALDVAAVDALQTAYEQSLASPPRTSDPYALRSPDLEVARALDGDIDLAGLDAVQADRLACVLAQWARLSAMRREPGTARARIELAGRAATTQTTRVQVQLYAFQAFVMTAIPPDALEKATYYRLAHRALDRAVAAGGEPAEITPWRHRLLGAEGRDRGLRVRHRLAALNALDAAGDRVQATLATEARVLTARLNALPRIVRWIGYEVRALADSTHRAHTRRP